jgi:hypothetical protein
MSIFTLGNMKLILIILIVACTKEVKLEQYIHWHQKMGSASGHHWCMGFFTGLSDSVILFYVNEQIRVANEVLLVINLHRMYFNSLCWFQKDVTIHSWTCEANSDNIDSGMYKSSEVRTIHPLASKNGQRLRPPLVYRFFLGFLTDILFYVNEQIRVANEVLLGTDLKK